MIGNRRWIKNDTECRQDCDADNGFEVEVVDARAYRELFAKYKELKAREMVPGQNVKEIKPPIGIMPEQTWKEQRAWDLMKCILRHENAESIEGVWFDELRKLLNELWSLNPIGRNL